MEGVGGVRYEDILDKIIATSAAIIFSLVAATGLVLAGIAVVDFVFRLTGGAR